MSHGAQDPSSQQGQRIVVTGGPWPERHGCTGTIVVPTSEAARIYPHHGKGKGEVIVCLDNDPLHATSPTLGIDWTCAIDRKNVKVLVG